MRVLVTTPSLPEPAGGEIARIATNGARACVLVGGAQSFVVASTKMRSDDTPTPSVEHALIAVESSGNDPGDAIGWDLLALVEESELVHVHAPFTRFGELSILAARTLRKPLVVTLDGPEASTLGRDAGLLNLVSVVITPSRSAPEISRATAGVSVIPGPVDTDFYEPGPPGPSRDAVVCIAPIRSGFDLERLLKSTPTGTPVALVGSDHAIEPGLGSVTMLDANDQDAVRGWYRRAVAVITSLPGFAPEQAPPQRESISMLEAMSCGAPVTCGPLTPWAEHVTDGVTGFITRSDEELAARLQSLVTSRALAAELGGRAREDCVKRCSLEVAGEKLVGIYAGLG